MSKVNEIDAKVGAVAPERKPNQYDFDGCVKAGVAWIRKSKKGVFYLSGNLGNKCNVMIYPVGQKFYEAQKDYTLSISSSKPKSEMFPVGGLDFFRDNGEIWFEGYIFDNKCVVRKNKHKDGNQPDYTIYFGVEIEHQEDVRVPYDEFEKSFAE
jgi:uncharacterized protein (DUF736 family)